MLGLLSGILLLSACGQVTPLPHPINVSESPSPPSTSTQTPLPSATPTASITPLPTIPTFTPTFDVSTIVTVTPAPKAECPVEIQNQSTTDIFPKNGEPYDEAYIDQILEFLNGGGAINTISAELNKPNKWGLPYGTLSLKDITNDNAPELFITIYFSEFVLKCDSQTYTIIYSRDYGIGGTKLSTSDLNKNSILELEVSISPCAGTFCPEMWLYEWDGSKLKTLAHNTDNITSTADINGDGITEIIGIKLPWSKEYDLRPTGRAITKIYFWNGSYFIEKTYYSEAIFRFQAIQDADNEVTKGNIDKAFQLYDETIENINLEWWSPERNAYETDRINALLNSEFVLSTQPISDLTEYPRLAAYAYYRIMLLHLVQNQETEATTTYTALQQEFGNDPYAHSYVEMASAFWEAYQSTHKMYDGCAAAIQYAVEHPEILTPLGSDYHGSQSHIYVPVDVCPFR
jgi:hypothetical protein